MHKLEPLIAILYLVYTSHAQALKLQQPYFNILQLANCNKFQHRYFRAQELTLQKPCKVLRHEYYYCNNPPKA
jgi:hypothetical protein